MQKLYSKLFLSPDDVGMRGYNIDEIAIRMKRSEDIDQSSLIDFARNVNLFLEIDDDNSSPTTAVTRTE